MRILVITPGFLPDIGGAEVIIHDIYNRLGTRHQVVILARKSSTEEMPAGFEPFNYQIWRYTDWMNFGRLGGRMLMRGIVPPFSIGATLAGIRAIQAFKPDIVNINYAIYTGLTAIWSSRIKKIPAVLSLIGRDSAPGPLTPHLWSWYADRVTRHATFTTFASNYCRNFHKKIFSRSAVIQLGVDIEKFRPSAEDESLKQKLNIERENRVIFSLQRLEKIKRVDVVLKAFQVILKQREIQCILVIGGVGRELDPLKNLAEDLGIIQSVRFAGFIPEPDLPRYFSIADVFVTASEYETFGIVLAQAMASGVPVVSINSTAIPEVVEDGETGLLSPPGDEHALAKNIQRLLTDTCLCEKMSRQARTTAVSNFNIDLIAEKYESLFTQAVERKTTL